MFIRHIIAVGSCRSGVTGKTNYESLSVAATNQNRLTGFGYDAAGNMTSNGGASYTYDAENRLITTAGMSYLYDGDGKRVEKCTEGSTPGTCATNATGTLYWTGTGSDPLAETDLSGNVLENYIFFNGQRIARRDASTKAVHYYFSDHLGTHSLITDANGDMSPQSESDFYPYGGEIPITTGDPNHYKFTGKERDPESGLDYFGARFNASSLGRFMTPDWSESPTPVPNADFEDPQSLNLYSYVRNNPITDTDPDGHCDWCQRLGNYLNGDGWNTDAEVVENRRNWMIQNVKTDEDKERLRNAKPDEINRTWRYITDENYRNSVDQMMQAAGMVAGQLTYEPNPKHGPQQSGNVSPEPTDGPGTLQKSVQVKETSTARVGVDKANNEFVMFRETSPGTYHGYAVKWSDLPNEAKSALVKAGQATARGKIVP